MKIAGHTKHLEAYAYGTCKDVVDGFTFQFRGEGVWIISYESLEKLYKSHPRTDRKDEP